MITPAASSPLVLPHPGFLDVDKANAGGSLWEHISPHLDHRTIAFQNSLLMRQLLKLSKLRELRFEPQATNTFKVVIPDDVIALAIYLTGVKSPHPCFRCLFKKGPFEGCILISPEAPIGVQTQLKTCANCVYKGHRDHCGLDACITHGTQQPTSPDQLEAVHIPDDTPVAKQAAEAQGELPGDHPEDSSVNHDRSDSMIAGFSELAVACYSAGLEKDKGKKTTSMAAAQVTPFIEQNTGPLENEAENITEEHQPPVPEPENTLATPERRSLRIVLKSSRTVSMPTATPPARNRKSSGVWEVPKTPTDCDQDRDLEWAPTPGSRRSNRLRSLSMTQHELRKGEQNLQSLVESSCTPKTSSAKKRKLGLDTSPGGSAGNNSSRHQVVRRDIHLGRQGPSSSSSATLPPSPPSSTQYHSHDVFRLEDWEMAPGRLRHGTHSRFPYPLLRPSSLRFIDVVDCTRKNSDKKNANSDFRHRLFYNIP